MTRQENESQATAQIGRKIIDAETPPRRHLDDKSTAMPAQRDPSLTLRGCQRILILGRTGSGKTTLARELAAAIGVPHVELDALYFGPNFSTAPLPVLRDRTRAPSGYRDLARLPLGCVLVEAREAGSMAYLSPQSAGGRDGGKGETPKTVPPGRERGTYGAPITQGAAS
jgi:hypothetical protein